MPTASEVIASAIADDVFDVDPEPQAKRIADSILSALDKAGYQLCPKQPTETMRNEGGHWWYACLHNLKSKEENAEIIYLSMLSAHAKEEAQ